MALKHKWSALYNVDWFEILGEIRGDNLLMGFCKCEIMEERRKEKERKQVLESY